MKLILCRLCGTTAILTHDAVRCQCGESQGVYLDDRNAIYSGPCVPLGIDNHDLAEVALDRRTQFSGFRIPSNSRYFRRVDDEIKKPRFVPTRSGASFSSPHQKAD